MPEGFRLSRLLLARMGQGGVVFVSCRRVPLSRLSTQHENLVLEGEFFVVPLRLLLSRAARLGLVNLKANLLQGLACFILQSISLIVIRTYREVVSVRDEAHHKSD